MDMKEMVGSVKILIGKAEKAEKADDALKFSQAATNAANAIACMTNINK